LKTAALRLAASMQGLSGDSIAIILAVGLVLGTFPVYGCPTVLCLLAALTFRLNVPALQVVNQLSSPLQLALVIPFARLGERILGDQILGSPATTSNTILSRLSELTRQAVTGWLCISVPLGFLLYIVLSYALRRRRPACFNELESPA
jgi:uncharacterized protein (DUF2062 family)